MNHTDAELLRALAAGRTFNIDVTEYKEGKVSYIILRSGDTRIYVYGQDGVLPFSVRHYRDGGCKAVVD